MEWTQQFRNWLKARVAVCRDALAGDFNYGKDYFIGMDLWMTLAGVRFNTARDRLRRWWKVYRVVIHLTFVVVFWNMVRSVIQKEKLEIVLSILVTTSGSIMCIVGMFTFARNYEQLMAVRQYLNQAKFGRDQNTVFLLRSKTFYRIRRIVFGSALCNIICVTLSLFIMDDHFIRLPFNVRDQYPVLQNMAEIVRNFLLGGPCIMFSLLFTTIYILLTGMRTELAVIADSFGHIFDRANNRAQLKVESEPGNSKQLHLMTKYYFMKYAHEEFRDCVILHQEFLEKLNAIRPLLNATFLIFYYMTTVCTACGVFYLLYVRAFSIYGLLIVYGTAVLFIGITIFTGLVTRLTEMNESIGEQVYDLDWPMMLEFIPQLASEYRSMRATILTVMIVSQQPLRLNCYGFFEFTQNQVTELVDMAYSLFGFVKNFV